MMNLKELMREVRSNKRSQDREVRGAKINDEKLRPGVFISWLLKYCAVSFLWQKGAASDIPGSTCHARKLGSPLNFKHFHGRWNKPLENYKWSKQKSIMILKVRILLLVLWHWSTLTIQDNVGFTLSLHMSTKIRLWSILTPRLCHTHIWSLVNAFCIILMPSVRAIFP